MEVEKSEDKKTEIKEVKKQESEKDGNTPKTKFFKKIVIGLVAGACAICCGIAIRKATAYKTFDAFSVVDVVYDGLDGDGTASTYCENQVCEYNGAEISYSLDKDTGLSEGDTVTLTVDIDNEKEFAEAHGGYIPKALSKEYTVKGLYKYITSPDDIPDGVLEYYDTCIKEAFNEKAEELNKIHDNDSSGNYIGYYNIEYVSNFVCTPKDSGSNWHNEWHLVYKINAEGGYASYLLGGTSGSFYMDIDFPEVSISDESDYFAGMTSLEGIFYTAINDCIEADAKTDFDLTLSSYAITNIYTPGTKIYSRVYKSLDDIKENYNEIENYNCVYDF